MTRGTRNSRVWIAVLSGLVLLAGLPRVEGAKLLSLPKDRVDWEAERPRVNRTITTALEFQTPRPDAPSFKVLHREARDGIPVETFEIASDSGTHVRGILVLPLQAASGERVPAVNFLGDDPWLGAKEPLNPGPDGGPPALVLARRGFAVLCLDIPFLTEHRPSEGYHLYIPGTDGEGTNTRRPLWVRVPRNDLMSLDALLADPGIDPKRVDVLGYGLGARAPWG